MDTLFVKPVDGGVVLDPQSGLRLHSEGATVPRNSYWLRRLNDGSVIEAPEPAKTALKTNAALAKREE